MSKRFSLSKILVVFFMWGGESPNDSILIFFSYFFGRSGSLDYCYFLSGGIGSGVGGERRKVHEGGTGCGHMPLLLASETMSFFEAPFPFLRSKLPWLFFGVDVHGVEVSGGGIPDGGGGVECDRGSGCVVFSNRSCEVSLAKELVDFLIPSFGHSWDHFHPVDLV